MGIGFVRLAADLSVCALLVWVLVFSGGLFWLFVCSDCVRLGAFVGWLLCCFIGLMDVAVFVIDCFMGFELLFSVCFDVNIEFSVCVVL